MGLAHSIAVLGKIKHYMIPYKSKPELKLRVLPFPSFLFFPFILPFFLPLFNKCVSGSVLGTADITGNKTNMIAPMMLRH